MDLFIGFVGFVFFEVLETRGLTLTQLATLFGGQVQVQEESVEEKQLVM